MISSADTVSLHAYCSIELPIQFQTDIQEFILTVVGIVLLAIYRFSADE